jgi:hypothetical protein
MSNPTAGDVHVDAALSDLAISWGAQQYVWDKFFPVVQVPKQSDKYYVFDKDYLRTNEAGIRAPGTLANRGGYALSSSSFFCDNYAMGKSTPNEVIKNADPAINPDEADLTYCTEMVNRKLEIDLVTAAFAASIWGTDVTGASSTGTNQVIYWSTLASSSPIEDVRYYQDVIQKATGWRPNRLVVGREVFTKLLDHPDIVARLAVTGLQVATEAIVAQILGVDQLIVAAASYNSAAEGATASNAFVAGKNALLYYAPRSQSKDIPSAGYTFRWGPRAVLNYEDAPVGKQARVIEVHDYVDFVVTASSLGVFFSGIVA